MEHSEKQYWYWLSKVEEAGGAARRKLFAAFGSAREIFFAKETALLRAGITEKAVRALLSEQYRRGVFEEFHKLRERDIYFITKDEQAFPGRLRELEDGPDYLFYRGELPEDDVPSVAIIGARECSSYGRGVARLFAGELAGAGIQIISGMARGVDGQAQAAALSYGKSYAVLGCGVDICYPAENFSLYEELSAKGGILSEYPPGTAALPFHFPMRNRIISGLADGLVVVEARKKSGTLITVDYALEQGKDVFAVPGRIGEALSEGCNELLRQGASLVTGSADILEELMKHYPAGTNLKKLEKNKFLLEDAEKIVYAYLRLEPRHIEELLPDVGCPLPELMKILFSLEAKGAVYSPAGNYYARAVPV
ncbi:MAG: DNA-processing protein DprA [Lachnospiraceae bacterium]|nr:DNA-processing protein DprA [Lachnospiraceae bacterium]